MPCNPKTFQGNLFSDKFITSLLICIMGGSVLLYIIVSIYHKLQITQYYTVRVGTYIISLSGFETQITTHVI